MQSSQRELTFLGRILFLTEDPTLVIAQLDGVDLPHDAELRLLENVSTDEIIPAWAALHDDSLLGRYCYVGLRTGCVQPDAVARGGFTVVVSGASKGCGSSREAAPYCELAAGVRLVIAPRFEKIYRQNAENIGLLTSCDFSLIPRIRRGEPIPVGEFTRGLDALSAAVVAHGGLFALNRARLAGLPNATATPERMVYGCGERFGAGEPHEGGPRLTGAVECTAAVRSPGDGRAGGPMTLSEKIIAAHAVPMARARDLSLGDIGAARVVPGDSLFARADVRFSHEYVTAMAEGLMRRGFGPGAVVTDPDSVVAYRDHLILLESVMPATHRAIGLAENARGMARRQAEFARRMGIHLCGEVDSERGGAEGICHQKVIEDLALPGQLVVGTDSHTCTAGALGCLAFGVGSTDMANAWVTGDVRVTVPETVRCVLLGRLRAGVCAKDVALAVLAMPYFKSGEGVGKIVEFCGAGAASLDIDERATLTNMAVEAGCVTGIVEADEVVVEYLATRRSLARSDVRQMIVKADRGAEYAETLEMNLSEVVPMVATPGDPRNSVPLSSLGAEVRIDIAYGGSCTGGKCADMDMYAAVVRSALDRGEKIHPSVRFYIQFGSQAVRRYAMERGYLEMFEKVGATLLEPACGACIGAGPGVSTTSTEVTVSAQNRNYPGRSGPGQVYLASPWVVAASAMAGRITPFVGL